MKKIQSKTKVLEWSHYSLIFSNIRATHSVSGDGILPKLKLIKAFMVVLVTCKNEEVLLKN